MRRKAQSVDQVEEDITRCKREYRSAIRKYTRAMFEAGKDSWKRFVHENDMGIHLDYLISLLGRKYMLEPPLGTFLKTVSTLGPGKRVLEYC